ncbi:MAG: hypothetical protein Kapaf2KO_13270 [Candidatus Kapaibacteriales bacterium]
MEFNKIKLKVINNMIFALMLTFSIVSCRHNESNIIQSKYTLKKENFNVENNGTKLIIRIKGLGAMDLANDAYRVIFNHFDCEVPNKDFIVERISQHNQYYHTITVSSIGLPPDNIVNFKDIDIKNGEQLTVDIFLGFIASH